MRVPLPRMPRWLDRSLDWINVDIGPRLWRYQPRRLDLLAFVLATIGIVIDGMFYRGWYYALLIDPVVFVFGWMIAVWFI